MGDSLEQLNLPRKAEEVYKMALKQTGEGIKDQKNFQKGYTTSCFNLAKIQFERNESSSCVENLELCINAYQRFNKPVDRRVLNLYGSSVVHGVIQCYTPLLQGVLIERGCVCVFAMLIHCDVNRRGQSFVWFQVREGWMLLIVTSYARPRRIGIPVIISFNNCQNIIY